MTTSIYDTDIDAFDDLVYIYDEALRERAAEMRTTLIEQRAVYPLSLRPVSAFAETHAQAPSRGREARH